MAIDPDNKAGLSSFVLDQIDACCLEFERHLRSGDSPAIEEFLNPELSEVDRGILLAELIVLEIDYRKRRGETPEIKEYETRFSSHGDTVRDVFQTDLTRQKSVDTQASNPTNVESFRKPVEEIPTRIGRYRIGKSLGTGGFATVCLAHDEELRRDVAIKFPRAEFPGVDGSSDLFLQEARTLATLSYPSIAAVYDVGRLEDRDECYVVSQYIDDGDLAQRLASGRPPLEQSLEIVIEMAKALEYAHSQGFVHRDVKPSNILLDSTGKPWLADFGLALNESDVGLNRMEFAGTRDYMSPEQIRGEGHLVDGRADIYSLGVVLYELLTGKKPFVSDDLNHLADQILYRFPRPPRQINNEIPFELERICLKAMSKSPADRYTTAGDFAHDLSDVLDSLKDDPVRKTPNRSIILAAAVIGLLFIGSPFVWSWINGSGSSRTNASTNSEKAIESIAVLPFRPLQLEPDDAYLGLSLADAVIMRLSQHRKLHVRPTGSIRTYVDQPAEPVSAGRDLQVDAVVDASIQKISDKTRISVRLLRTQDGETLWSDTFEGGPLDTFSLQDAIVGKIANAISSKLDPRQHAASRERHIPEPSAYDAYLKGRYHWHQRSHKNGIEEAIEHFQNSIDIDPLFPLAYVGLAECYALFDYYDFYEVDDTMPLARAAANEALRLDGELTEAHRVLAFITFSHDWNWERAEKMYLRAIELNPNDGTARQWYGELLMYLRRFEESRIQFERAAELNPLSQIIFSMQGSPYLFDRKVEKARDKFNAALEIYPKSVIAQFGLAYCHELEGDYEQALKIFQRYTRPTDKSTAATLGEAWCLAKLGRTKEAEAILNALSDLPDGKRFTRYGLATISASLGEHDQAFTWLDLAYEQRDDLMVMLLVDPHLDDLRNDPRLDELLERMGFPK